MCVCVCHCVYICIYMYINMCIYIYSLFRYIHIYRVRTIDCIENYPSDNCSLDVFPLDDCPLPPDGCHWGQLPPRNLAPWIIVLWVIVPRMIAPWWLPPDNFPSGKLPPSRIIVASMTARRFLFPDNYP